MRRIVKQLSAAVRTAAPHAVVFAALAHIVVIWITICGDTTASVICLLTSVVLGSVAGQTQIRQTTLSVHWMIKFLVTSALIPAVCLFPFLLETALTFGGQTFLAMGVPWFFAGFLAASIPTAAYSLCAWFWVPCAANEDSARFSFTAAGATAGVAAVWLAGVFDMPLYFAVLGLVVTAVLVERTSRWRQVDRAVHPSNESAAASSTKTFDVWESIAGLAFGILLYVTFQISTTLYPASLNILLLATVLSLVAVSLTSRVLSGRLSPVAFAIVFVLMCTLPHLHELLVDVNLTNLALSQSASLVVAFRAIQLATLCFGGWIMFQTATRHGKVRHSHLKAIGIGVLIGVMGRHWGAASSAVLGLALAGICIPVIRQLLAATPDLKIQRLAITGFLLAGVSLTAAAPVETSQPSRVLFNSRSVHAVRYGVQRSMIPHSDAARLMETRNVSSGTLDVWNAHGDLVEFRLNGIRLGSVSRNASTTPHPPAEILTACVPLSIHPNARNVLVVGDDVGSSLRVCSGFPVQTVTCLRRDESLTQCAAEITWKSLQTSPLQDDRITVRHGPLALSIRTTAAASFDVVVIDPPHPDSLAGHTTLTREFLQGAGRLINADGLIAYRLRTAELGPSVLLGVLSGLRSQMSQIAAIQMMPGEMLVLGTNSKTPLMDDGLLHRLQRQHVRKELSLCGWDWSQLAALSIIDSADPIGFFTQFELPEAPQAAHGGVAFRMTTERHRHANKSMETHALFSPHQMRIAEAVPYGEDHEEFRRRISAVAQQLEILTGFPDHPWAYRKSLKTEMLRNPRPPVETVERGAIKRRPHPLDEYRKKYFTVLGRTLQRARTGSLSSAPFEELARFSREYEPLLSHFAHHELIRLHEMTRHPQPHRELQHRLHSVYFTENRDCSIRDLVGAMDQILETPELLDNEEQYDHLNSMIQELISRWEARTRIEPASARVVQNDVDQCVRAANRGLDAMQELCDDVGVDRSDFLIRRKFVTAALIVPLRAYRDEVLAHRIQNKSPVSDHEAGPDDMPLLIDPGMLSTN